jgi:Flp pilus assembly protein TadD
VSKRNPKFLISLVLILAVIATSIVYFTRSSDNPDLTAAREAIARREFQQAGELLNNYLLTHPDDKTIRLLAAQTARRRGDLITALTLVTKCQEQSGPNEPVELELRLLRLQQGKLAEASTLIATYANQPEAPETPIVMEAVAVGILNKLAPTETAPNSLSHEAVPLLKQAGQAADLWLKLRPNRADQVVGHLWRGRVHVLEGNQKDGVAELRKALEIDQDNASVRFLLASVIAQADPAEAASHLTILLNSNPNDEQVAFRLATAYRGLGRLDEAERLLDQMLSVNPKEISVLVERGLVAMDRSRLAEADRFLSQAFKLAPNVPEVNLALSQYMQLRGDTAKVKEYRDRFDRLEAAKKK